MPGKYFLNMIEHLRQHEDVILYVNILQTDTEEEAKVVSFLEQEYETESLDYPGTPPDFDKNAALWAAKTIYTASQLLVYRKNRVEELGALLPPYDKEQNAEAIISADLCLRFLPSVLRQLTFIDPEDALIPILEGILTQWHYSGTNYTLDIEKLNFEAIIANDCLRSMYADRVTRYKKLALATHPALKEIISGDMGNLGKEYWNEFKQATIPDE